MMRLFNLTWSSLMSLGILLLLLLHARARSVSAALTLPCVLSPSRPTSTISLLSFFFLFFRQTRLSNHFKGLLWVNLANFTALSARPLLCIWLTNVHCVLIFCQRLCQQITCQPVPVCALLLDCLLLFAAYFWLYYCPCILPLAAG